MFAKPWKLVGTLGTTSVCAAAMCSPALGARYADVLGNYEPGNNVDAVFGSDPIELFDNPDAALGGPDEQVALSQGTLSEIVSLGGWSDNPSTGTNTHPPALIVGFSIEILNAPGNDLLVVGNAPSSFTFYEPGFIEVAIESDGGGATANGWQDETFFLVRPGNYDLINDPRTANNPITITSNPDFSLTYSAPFDDNNNNLAGYFDVSFGGDAFDIDDAIDINGDAASLNSIAYVRLRSVSDSAFPFGTSIAPDVDYLEVLELPGDFDGDGFAGIGDLNVVLANWNASVPNGAKSQGDGSGDGFVGIDDLNIVLANWNTGTPPPPKANVPEPASMLVCAGTLGAWISRRS